MRCREGRASRQPAAVPRMVVLGAVLAPQWAVGGAAAEPRPAPNHRTLRHQGSAPEEIGPGNYVYVASWFSRLRSGSAEVFHVNRVDHKGFRRHMRPGCRRAWPGGKPARGWRLAERAVLREGAPFRT